MGPVNPSEIKDTIEVIKSEGANFVNAPPVRGDWPIYTGGRDAARKKQEDLDKGDDCSDGT